MLSEISQTGKGERCMASFLCSKKKKIKLIETENRMVVATGLGLKGIGSQCLMDTEFQMRKMEQVLEVRWSEPYNNVKVLNATEPYTSEWLKG